MVVESAISITLSYFLSSATMIYAQHVTLEFPQPLINLLYPGIALFPVGIIGNVYHLYLLSKLRGKGEKEYKISKGGLFDYVICPHYLFEIIGFYGFSFISQTLSHYGTAKKQHNSPLKGNNFPQYFFPTSFMGKQ
jgi:very-long-chain enoyl-CoA reductase